MVLADVHLSDIIWSMLWLFFLFIWIMILVQVLIDLFRDHEMSGIAKALWVIALVFLPFITVFVYIIARGSHMAERSMKQQQALQQQMDSYVKQRVPQHWRGRADREGEGTPRRRHDHTGRVRSAEGEGTRLEGEPRHGARGVRRSRREDARGVHALVASAAVGTGGCAQRRRRPPRRCRVRAVRLLRVDHRDADIRSARGARPALLELPHDGAVLADARLPAHGPQPPSQRHGSHRRVRIGVPGI